ncbi:hypothetical protein [Streptomyces sp. 7N604]|uniref:hypothetical protein n=1 Tax=Streptomyces sp. 7N604 TaxID=3457415 RepID=UPI003FD5BF0D
MGSSGAVAGVTGNGADALVPKRPEIIGWCADSQKPLRPLGRKGFVASRDGGNAYRAGSG